MARLGAERDPDAFLGHWVHGLLAHWLGHFEESVEAFNRAAAVAGSRTPFVLTSLAVAYADWGKLDQARTIYDELLATKARTYVTFTSLAPTAAAAGDQDAAMELARRACDEREPLILLQARLFPGFQRLRDDPRFADVLTRLALPK
jgi:Flp pilus assembly protein TadD